MSTGEFNEIFVYADSLDWELTKETLKEVLEKEIRTPQYEKIYYLEQVSYEQFDALKHRRNIILLTSLESEGPVANVIKSIISPSLIDGINSGDYYIFQRENEWARKQMIILLVSKDIETLNRKIKENEGYILDLINQNVNERLKESLFRGRVDDRFSKKLYVKYGFGIKAHKDFYVVAEDSINNFIWFRRWRPDRMLFIHWMDAENGNMIDKDWFIKTRDKVTFTHMDSMVINPYKIQFEEVNFAGRDALKMRGFWEITHKVIGGPFISYAFYDQFTNRVYIVDVSVFHPGKMKEPYLRQLNIIAETFSTNPDDFM